MTKVTSPNDDELIEWRHLRILQEWDTPTSRWAASRLTELKEALHNLWATTEPDAGNIEAMKAARAALSTQGKQGDE